MLRYWVIAAGNELADTFTPSPEAFSNPEKTADMFNFNSMFTTNGTAGEQGTGLGLPLCKEFAERNEGKIWVESELGIGTKFTFTVRKSVS